MKALIAKKDRQLDRIEAAIAAIRRDPIAAQTNRLYLLEALEAERDEVLRSYGRRSRSISKKAA